MKVIHVCKSPFDKEENQVILLFTFVDWAFS